MTFQTSSTPGAHHLGQPFRRRTWRGLALSPVQFILLVALAAGAMLTVPSQWHAPTDTWLAAFVLLTGVSTALEFVSVNLPFDGDLSVATISHVAMALLVPAPFAAIGVGISVIIEELVRHRPIAKLVFNTSTYVLTVSTVSLAIGLIGSPPEAVRAHDNIRVAATFLLAAVGYYLMSTTIVSAVIAVSTRRSLWFLLRANTRNTAIAETSAAMMGGLVALIWTIEPLWTITLSLPGILVSRALKNIRQLENETRNALRQMAQIIDHRDPTTYHHSERVAAYSRALAVELELSDDDIELISQAASVHDLGKIGVPDRVLLKSGPLDESERTLMWLHTEIGAAILGHFRLFRPGASVVLHHHERWDGAGYPSGLRGEDIPLGARVVAVADSFDAMTEDRPYRRALTAAEAVGLLRHGAGSQWDPEIVTAFIRLIEEDRLPRPDPDEFDLTGTPVSSAA